MMTDGQGLTFERLDKFANDLYCLSLLSLKKTLSDIVRSATILYLRKCRFDTYKKVICKMAKTKRIHLHVCGLKQKDQNHPVHSRGDVTGHFWPCILIQISSRISNRFPKVFFFFNFTDKQKLPTCFVFLALLVSKYKKNFCKH